MARLRSFSRATEDRRLTQQAVPTQVRKLAEHAGDTLFEQIGKPVFLTLAGTELRQIGRHLMQQFKAAENAMTRFSGASGGQLDVGVICAGSGSLFSAATGRVHEAPPQPDAELSGPQPSRAADTHRRRPPRRGDHAAASERSENRPSDVRTTPRCVRSGDAGPAAGCCRRPAAAQCAMRNTQCAEHRQQPARQGAHAVHRRRHRALRRPRGLRVSRRVGRRHAVPAFRPGTLAGTDAAVARQRHARQWPVGPLCRCGGWQGRCAGRTGVQRNSTS